MVGCACLRPFRDAQLAVRKKTTKKNQKKKLTRSSVGIWKTMYRHNAELEHIWREVEEERNSGRLPKLEPEPPRHEILTPREPVVEPTRPGPHLVSAPEN